MAAMNPPDGATMLTLRLVGMRPGTSQDELVSALQRLYRHRSQQEIRGALDRLPLILSRSATEEQARKVQRFLESKGAILEVYYTPKERAEPPEPPHVEPSEAQPSGPPRTQEKIAAITPERPTPKAETPIPRVERRSKPRVHQGIQLHPMGVGEILDRTFRLLRQRFWLFLVIMLIPLGLAAAAVVVLGLLFGGMGLMAGGMGLPVDITMGIVVGLFTLLLIVSIFLVQIWAQGALIHAVSETYLGHQTSVSESYKVMWPRLGRLAGTILLMVFLLVVVTLIFGVIGVLIMSLGRGLMDLVGLLCIVVPGMLLFLTWLLADKVVVLEEIGWWKALKRSRELMKARTEAGFWKRPKVKAGLILLVAFLIGIAILILFQIPQMLFQFFLPDNMIALTLVQALYIVGNSLATTFASIAMILFYYDIRIRKEGFDLKMMAEKL